MNTNEKLSWILDDLLNIPGARHAVLASGDGLHRAHSKDADREMGETVSSAMSSLRALSSAVAGRFWPEERVSWQRSLIETDRGWVALSAASDGSYLAVAAAPETDMGALIYAMTEVASRLREPLATPPRTDNQPRA